MSVSWLPITEYSSKYRVSISTLRRRIKAQDIKFTFEEGKYLICDQPLKSHSGPPPSSRPSQVTARGPSLSFKEKVELPSVEAKLAEAKESQQEPLLSAANRLLNELKKAYSQILLEKEEHILHLREEVSDLKTLVRVLEAENERLSGN